MPPSKPFHAATKGQGHTAATLSAVHKEVVEKRIEKIGWIKGRYQVEGGALSQQGDEAGRREKGCPFWFCLPRRPWSSS